MGKKSSLHHVTFTRIVLVTLLRSNSERHQSRKDKLWNIPTIDITQQWWMNNAWITMTKFTFRLNTTWWSVWETLKKKAPSKSALNKTLGKIEEGSSNEEMMKILSYSVLEFWLHLSFSEHRVPEEEFQRMITPLYYSNIGQGENNRTGLISENIYFNLSL